MKTLFTGLFLLLSFAFATAQKADAAYFEDCEVLFGTRVDAQGQLVGETEYYDLTKTNRADAVVLVSLGKPFKCTKILVSVVDEDGAEVGTMNLRINPEEEWFKFDFSFKDPGSYVVELFNEFDVLVGTGEVNVY